VQRCPIILVCVPDRPRLSGGRQRPHDGAFASESIGRFKQQATSDRGQTEKNSARSHLFRFTLELRHYSMRSACLKRASSGLVRAANQKSVEALHGLVGLIFSAFLQFCSAIRINPSAYTVVGRAASSTAYRRSKSRMATVCPTFFPIEACTLSLIGNLWTPPPIAMNAVRSG